MNGQEVYRFAVKTVPKAVTDAVEQAGLHLEEIDLFLLHQANYRIIEAVSKRLGQPMENFRPIWRNVGIFLRRVCRFCLIMSIIMV